MTIRVDMDPCESASTFSYLGCTTEYNNSNCVDLYQNMSKDQRRWDMTSGVLVKAGEAVQARTIFYKAVVQAVLFYRKDR